MVESKIDGSRRPEEMAQDEAHKRLLFFWSPFERLVATESGKLLNARAAASRESGIFLA